MRSRWVILFVLVIGGLMGGAYLYGPTLLQKINEPTSDVPVISASPDPSALMASPIPTGSPAAVASPTGPDFTVDANGLSKATVMIVPSRGNIKIKFFPKDAPLTSAHIAELVAKGFYNGLRFHRVEPGQLVQTGDPEGTGAGGSGLTVKSEVNFRKHVEGAVGLARRQDPDSGDSQFYIMMRPMPPR